MIFISAGSTHKLYCGGTVELYVVFCVNKLASLLLGQLLCGLCVIKKLSTTCLFVLPIHLCIVC